MPETRSTADDVSGTDTDGVTLTDTEVLNRVVRDGSLAVVRGPAERLRRSGWRDDLVSLADMRGLRVSVRDTGRVVLVLDVEWAGWAPEDDYTDPPPARDAHPSRGHGPRAVPEA